METNLTFQPEEEFIVENDGKKIIVPERVLDDIDVFSFKDFTKAETVCLKEKEYPVIICAPYTFIIENCTSENDLTIYKCQKIVDIHHGDIQSIPAYLVIKEDKKGYGSTLEEALNDLEWYIPDFTLTPKLIEEDTILNCSEAIQLYQRFTGKKREDIPNENFSEVGYRISDVIKLIKLPSVCSENSQPNGISLVVPPDPQYFRRPIGNYLNEDVNIKLKHGKFDLEVYTKGSQDKPDYIYNIFMAIATASQVMISTVCYLKHFRVDIATCADFYMGTLYCEQLTVKLSTIHSFILQNVFFKAYLNLEISTAHNVELRDLDPDAEAWVRMKIHTCAHFECNFNKFPKLLKVDVTSVGRGGCVIKVPHNTEVDIIKHGRFQDRVHVADEVKCKSGASKKIEVWNEKGAIIYIK